MELKSAFHLMCIWMWNEMCSYVTWKTHRKCSHKKKFILSHLVTFEIGEKLCLAFHLKSLFFSVSHFLSYFCVEFCVLLLVLLLSSTSYIHCLKPLVDSWGYYSCIDLRLHAHDKEWMNEYAEKKENSNALARELKAKMF